MLEIRIEAKKIYRVLDFNQSQWLTQYLDYNKKNSRRKGGDKDGKALHKLMNNSAYVKTMENRRNRVDLNF